VLHQDGTHTVWHTGIVAGPTGSLHLNLQIDAPEERWFRSPGWQSGHGPPLIDAYVEVPGEPGPIVPTSFGHGSDRFSFHYLARLFPVTPDRLPGATLHIKIHPLDLHLVIDLGPGR
jgi:hypothetical protein